MKDQQIRSQRGFAELGSVLAFILNEDLDMRNLLALARLALPVGCGTNFLAGWTPKRMAGAGPVFCGTNACAVGIEGMGGIGGIGGGLCPKPVG